MDTVVIEQLRVETIVGIYAWERVVRQTLLFTVELATDTRQAATTGDLQYALNYAQVCTRIEEYLADNHFQLLETLAEQVAGMIMNEFAVTGLRLSVCKTDAVIAVKHVGVTIVRGDFTQG